MIAQSPWVDFCFALNSRMIPLGMISYLRKGTYLRLACVSLARVREGTSGWKATFVEVV